MNSSSLPAHPPVLTSWKDIARYMGKGVRTVQRWEQDFGLPVRRPLGSNKKAILARPHDLDAWVALRCSSRSQVAAAPAELGGQPHPLNGSPSPRGSLGVLSVLNAEIQTSRLLRSSNRALLEDVRSALHRLHSELQSFESTR